MYNYIQTRKVYGKCTEHEMCVLMSSTMLVQNSLRSGKCSVCTAQKATEEHLDLNLEWWLIVSDLNGKEFGWTFSEHLAVSNFMISAQHFSYGTCIASYREILIGSPDRCERI